MTYETEAELREEVTHLGEIIAGFVGLDRPKVEGLTPMESRIVRALEQAGGRTLGKDVLMNALYFDRHGKDEPEDKIVPVFLCHIGKKRPDIGSRILNSYGIGWCLVPV